ncbi:MAG: (d)CMP kinase [Rhodospirillales bacterium]|nr:(d)CMP kinase [Rhodospirillales bacterium]
MSDAPRVIAIDGPAGAGKGTLGRSLARHFGFALLETGLLYRATALRVLRDAIDPSDQPAIAKAAKAIEPADLADPDLRTEPVGNMASRVSAYPEVRAALLEYQRNFASHPPGGAKGAILDGRDIGTRICPDADVKLFVTASLEVRALRRLKELRDRGEKAIHGHVLEDMRARDARDTTRALAPLEPAADAFLIDTDGLDADGVFAAALGYVQSRSEVTRSRL